MCHRPALVLTLGLSVLITATAADWRSAEGAAPPKKPPFDPFAKIAENMGKPQKPPGPAFDERPAEPGRNMPVYVVTGRYGRFGADKPHIVCHMPGDTRESTNCHTHAMLEFRSPGVVWSWELTTLNDAITKGLKLCPKCLWFAMVGARKTPRWTADNDGPHFVHAGWKILLDRKTGLLWELDSGESDISYEKAETRTKGLTLDGVKDWRLPTTAELKSADGFMGGDEPNGHFTVYGGTKPLEASHWATDTAEKSGVRAVRAVKTMPVPPDQWHEFIRSLAVAAAQAGEKARQEATVEKGAGDEKPKGRPSDSQPRPPQRK